jgi:hypothetical protein
MRRRVSPVARRFFLRTTPGHRGRDFWGAFFVFPSTEGYTTADAGNSVSRGEGIGGPKINRFAAISLVSASVGPVALFDGPAIRSSGRAKAGERGGLIRFAQGWHQNLRLSEM